MVFGDDEFLIIKHCAADEFRSIAGGGRGMESVRSEAMALIRDGDIQEERRTRFGPLKVVRVWCRRLSLWLDLSLIWGESFDGKAQIAPDGLKRCVYLVKVEARK
jgi:hypothetical protein